MNVGTNLSVSKSPRRRKKEPVKPHVPFPYKETFPKMSNCPPSIQEIMQEAIDNGFAQHD